MKRIFRFWFIVVLVINTLIFGWNTVSWLIAGLLITPVPFKILKNKKRKVKMEG